MRRLLYFTILTTPYRATGDETNTVGRDRASALSIYMQKGPRGVNQALDERLGISADQTTGKLRYDWLENLPPILALDIMRADFDTAKGKAYKVMHHLQLEDTIYMDRFLAPSKSPRDSALAQARERAFAASEELERAQERYVTLTELKDGLQLHDAVDAVADWLPEAKKKVSRSRTRKHWPDN